MAALGSGSDLWRVDVVLRRDGGSDVESLAIVAALSARLEGLPTSPDEDVLGGPRPEASYDMPPPEGSVGVSCWVRADTVGEAVQVGHDAVVAAASGVTGLSLPLWDLRVVPRTSIMTREEHGLP
jgi:hypothetical protein